MIANVKTIPVLEQLDAFKRIVGAQYVFVEEEIRHNYAQQIRAISCQRARELIRPIVHALRRVQDTRPRLRTNLRMVIDGARNGHLRNAQSARNVS